MQVDEEGHRQILLYEIIDHRQYIHAIGKEDVFKKTLNRTKQRKMTTEGWQLCIKYKHGYTNWVSLKETTQPYPVELANYAKRMKIDDEPVFAWWVPYVQKKRELYYPK